MANYPTTSAVGKHGKVGGSGSCIDPFPPPCLPRPPLVNPPPHLADPQSMENLGSQASQAAKPVRLTGLESQVSIQCANVPESLVTWQDI